MRQLQSHRRRARGHWTSKHNQDDAQLLQNKILQHDESHAKGNPTLLYLRLIYNFSLIWDLDALF